MGVGTTTENHLLMLLLPYTSLAPELPQCLAGALSVPFSQVQSPRSSQDTAAQNARAHLPLFSPAHSPVQAKSTQPNFQRSSQQGASGQPDHFVRSALAQDY